MILTGQTKVLADKSVPMSLIHHKSHMEYPDTEPGPPR
jgi:hypothetical protein